ncbi:LOG family protein [Patescibacteria group bacterium]
MPLIKNIAFFGFADSKPKDKNYQQAFDLARTLALKGYVIVNGGGPGIMDAATQGAESVGGDTLAITFYPQNAPGFEGRYPKNITDKEIKTGNYIERMFSLLEHGDLYIIFKGGTGTLSEFATAWCLSRLYFGFHKPFILYGKFWHKIIQVLKQNLFLRKEDEKVFTIVSSCKEAMEAIEKIKKEYSSHMKKVLKNNEESAFMLGYKGPEF